MCIGSRKVLPEIARTTGDEMSIDEGWRYLRMMKKRYVEASRTAKGPLWDEVEGVAETGHAGSIII